MSDPINHCAVSLGCSPSMERVQEEFQKAIDEGGNHIELQAVAGDDSYATIGLLYTRPYTETEWAEEKRRRAEIDDYYKRQRRAQYEALKEEFEGD